MEMLFGPHNLTRILASTKLCLSDSTENAILDKTVLVEKKALKIFREKQMLLGNVGSSIHTKYEFGNSKKRIQI